ncbi:GPI mannosyltransferase 2 [Nematocida sp. AWRm80]|nr:GPI mannosyltransferase 2 [Nematocida sp. AWRm80]
MKIPVKVWGASRLIVLSAAYLSSRLIPSHDYSSDLIHDSGWVSFLNRWDCLYFYNISRYGYVSDNSTVFLPLFPMLVRLLASSGLGYILSGVIISNVSFLLSACVLHSITEKYLGSKMAFRSTLLFCFSPCSILYSTLYSESLFCALVILGIDNVLCDRLNIATIYLMLASATRSNGFILSPLLFLCSIPYRITIADLVRVLLPILTFLGIQMYWLYTRFPYLKNTLPYSYIQEKYWDQGFLRFYNDKKNIPNVIVGAPFIVLSIIILCSAYLNILTNTILPIWSTITSLKTKRPIPIINTIYKRYIKSNKINLKFTTMHILLTALLSFQVLVSIFFLHLNMHFRFVSYNPLIYWELSNIFSKDRYLCKLILFGYITFGIAYAILFGAYFPPA